ncbi:MAG: hypothetical protein H0Z32_00325 [Bacillaceae bacterium]|nr:hypothetical protein [Bacillaceae bacterium]
MNVKSIPFNMELSYDDELREQPVRSDEMMEGLNFLMDCLNIDSISRKTQAQIAGWIGVYARIARDYHVSVQYLKEAINLFEEMSETRGAFVQKLQLANTLHWKGEHTEAKRLFMELLQVTEENRVLEEYRDFLYQHYGKFLMDEGNPELARKYLQEALVIRKIKGNDELIQSTKMCLSKCLEQIEAIQT